MKILVDTSIWFLALRKKTLTQIEKRYVNELKELINELRVEMIGPIRQELLSGVKDEQKYNSLKENLKGFEDLAITEQDYEKAAEIFNLLRKSGIQGSHIDFLICAVALNHHLPIFTTDNDFRNYQKIIGVDLQKIRDELDENSS
jgi:hypothetical protein